MRIRRILTIAAALLAIVATMLAGSLATAQHQHGHGHGTPAAHGGHMMGTPAHDHHEHMGGTGTGVVYMTIENTGDEDDALIGATTDRAQAVEVHEMRVQNDVGVMLPHDGPLAIPAGETVSLEPAGLHIMLIDLNADIRLGDTFDLTLEFEHAGEVTIPVTAVLDAEDAEGEPVEAGDLEITGVWSRPAPRIDGGAPATPEATPAS
jgi:copper(I)-binding protein